MKLNRLLLLELLPVQQSVNGVQFAALTGLSPGWTLSLSKEDISGGERTCRSVFVASSAAAVMSFFLVLRSCLSSASNRTPYKESRAES